MKLSPIVHGAAAAAYVCGVVLFMQWLSYAGINGTMTVPFILLPLLVLSVALMSLAFFYEPARLLIANKADEALRFFAKTLIAFAALACVFALIAVAATML